MHRLTPRRKNCPPTSSKMMLNGFMASPAVSGRAFYLRTKTHLYRVESP